MTGEAVPAESSKPAASQPPIGLAAQLRICSAMFISAAIFWSVGWLVWQPADPRAPILMFGAAHPLMIVVVMAMLSIVSGALAVIVAGRSPALIAPAAVAFGLAALNLRGTEADLIGYYFAPRINGLPVWPTTSLILELWIWLGLIALGSAAGRWIGDRVLTGAIPSAAGGAAEPAKMLAPAILAAPVAYTLITIFSGSATDDVLKQQIYFAVGLGMLLAVVAGQFVFRSGIAWWPLLTVGIVGAAAYIFGQPKAGVSAGQSPDQVRAVVQLAFRVLPNLVARPLPIEYAALGTLGGILGLHFAGSMTPSAEPKSGS